MRNLDNHSYKQRTVNADTNGANSVAHSFLPRRKIRLDKPPLSNTSTAKEHSRPPAATQPNEQQALFDRIRLQLCSTLQVSLDLKTNLNTFFTQISQLIDISGLAFSGHQNNTQHSVGNTAHHTLSYQLDTGKQDVGEITYYSRARVNGHTLELLELATSTIVFPLLNAQLHQQALEQADTDPLTQLANRRCLENYLPSHSASSLRFRRPLSLLIIDIDHFKVFNDHYGHQTGDVVLQCVANALTETSRSSDRVFRYGGEEFVCVLDGTDASGAEIIAERLRVAVTNIDLENQANIEEMQLSVSIGFAELNDKETAKTLLQRADIALYQAKRKGRDCVIEG